MTADFRTLMSRPAISAEAPPPLPAGTYIGTQTGYKFGKARYDQNIDIVSFMYRLQSATDDIPPEMLEKVAAGLASRIISKDFEITDDKMFLIRQYLESVAEESLKSGRSFQEIIETETNGKTYLLEVTAKPGKGDKADIIYNNVGKVRAYKD